MEKEKLHVLNNNEPLSRKIVTTDLLDNLSSKPNNRVKYEPDYISLYDVLGFIDLDNANCQYEIEKLIDNCNDMLDISNISIIDTKFDFKNKCLVLSMLDGYDTTVWEIDVAIEGDKISIVRDTLNYNEQAYSLIYEYLPKLYEWVKYSDFKKVGNGKYFNVRPENSQFLIDFNYNGIKLHGSTMIEGFPKLYEISFTVPNDSCEVKRLSGRVKEIIMRNKDSILKNIYVDVKKCPYWLINTLYKFREDQLLKDHYITGYSLKRRHNMDK